MQVAATPTHRIVRNGYTYELDAADRTTRVTGTLTLAAGSRSRAAQAAAGGQDRRRTDDGGHYVAVRFNGPSDRFNHFAQDTGFNRGRYRALEDRWAKDVKDGRRVQVAIVPSYGGRSLRPAKINVVFWVDGKRDAQGFMNASRRR